MAAADWLDNRKTSKNGQEITFLILFLAILGSRGLCFVHAVFRYHGIWGTGSARAEVFYRAESASNHVTT